MNLSSSNQLNLYGIKNDLLKLTNLYKKDKLPSKILLSGQKGIGKEVSPTLRIGTQKLKELLGE